MSVSGDFSRNLMGQPRFSPSFIAIIVGGILLLFVRDLCFIIKQFFIPSIFVYAMTTALLGTIHRFISLHYKKKGLNSEQTIPICCRVIIYFTHILLLLGFIVYNFHHCVLLW